MRIDFLGLQAFLSIAERGSFQKAAVHLNLSPTEVSHRMRKLEDELGIKLFARTIREVTLTRAGIEFLPKAQKAIAGLEQSFDELKQQSAKRRERLDIACLPVFGRAPSAAILSRFHRTHPDVEVRIFETSSAAIAALVESGEVEFGPSVIHTNRWDLDVEAIAEVPLVLACPASHSLAKTRAVTWKELRNPSLIRVGSKTAIRSIIDDAMGAARLAPNWQYEVQHVETRRSPGRGRARPRGGAQRRCPFPPRPQRDCGAGARAEGRGDLWIGDAARHAVVAAAAPVRELLVEKLSAAAA